MISPFNFETRTGVRFKPGLSSNPKALRALAGPDVRLAMVITDSGLTSLGLHQGLVQALEGAGIGVVLFDGVKSDPTTASIDQAARLIRENGPELIIALGGGSPMDAAKLAAVVAEGDMEADGYTCLSAGLPRPSRQTWMIPTTAGTGAEMTRSVVFSNSTGRKVWAWGRELMPNLALLDPELTYNLPPHLTAATGLDALVHAIEAVGHKAATPLARAFGFEAMGLVAGALERVCADGKDTSARGEMMTASCLAGLAIDQAGCGLAHGMGHALGTMIGVHHGRAVALVLNAAMAWNAEGVPEIYAQVARALGVEGRGLGQAELAQAGAEEYRRILKAVGLETSLAKDGAGPRDVDRLVALTMDEENIGICHNNCRLPDEADLRMVAARVLGAE